MITEATCSDDMRLRCLHVVSVSGMSGGSTVLAGVPGTGSRAPAPTAAHPGVRTPRLRDMSMHPTGRVAPAPTAAPQCPPPERRASTCIHPMGRVAPAPTAAPPGAHPTRRSHTSTRPTSTRAPAPIAEPPGALPSRRTHTSRPTGTRDQGLTLAHFSAQLERFYWDRGCA